MLSRVLHVESKYRYCASLCYMYTIGIFQYVIQNSNYSRENTLYFVILELIPMLVSEVHVYITVILIVQLSSKPP